MVSNAKGNTMTFVQDADKTPVIFRKYPNIRGGEVIALFPAELGTYDPRLCSSFVHVGQHGSADPLACIDNTRPAREAEYADLRKELESAPYGYRLKVYQRHKREFYKMREAEARRLRNREVA